MGRCVGCVVEDANAGCLGPVDRRALLDALDAVPRSEHNRECNDLTSQHMDNVAALSKRKGQLRDRAERAERERDRLRADNDRLRRFVGDVAAEEPGNVAEQFRTIRRLAQNLVGALSADADADAEPNPVRSIEHDGEAALTRDFYRCPNTGEWVYRWCDERMALRSDHTADAEPDHDPYGVAGPCEPEPEESTRYQHRPECAFGSGWPKREVGGDPLCICTPSRAEGDEPDCPECGNKRCPKAQYHANACMAHGAGYQISDPPWATGDCLCGPNYLSIICEQHAEGGRPREADPQGTPSGNGDASVDGGGDDGRSRAEEAVVRSLCDRFGGGTPLLDSNIPVGDLARTAIDAALASGHVRLTDPSEPDISVEAYWEATEERDKAEARVRELEGLIRELVRDGLHREYRQDREPMGYCENCGEPWPCPTYRARRDVRDRTDHA